jgi:TolA-binding protein
MIQVCLASCIGVSCAYTEYDGFGYDDNPPPRDEYREAPKSIPAKKVIIQNRKAITSLKRRVSDLEERLAGQTSLIEGLNATIAEMQINNSMGISVQKPVQNDTTALIKELGSMIDKINESYVSKEELQKILVGKKLSTTGVSSSQKTVKKEVSSSSFDRKPTAKIYSEGVRLFIKQRYDESEKRFVITDTKGYKPAASNYYLGEIAYYTKKYVDAIFYFKKSAGLYDQASYIDVLLLHTAISLEKTGDISQAKSFYKNIIDNYPDKKSASIAKKKLKKL